jgi:hypothetical protein
LSAAMERVLDDPAAAHERAARARLRVEHELSIDARTARLMSVYADVLPSTGD